jgi:hypothetical protein
MQEAVFEVLAEINFQQQRFWPAVECSSVEEYCA